MPHRIAHPEPTMPFSRRFHDGHQSSVFLVPSRGWVAVLGFLNILKKNPASPSCGQRLSINDCGRVLSIRCRPAHAHAITHPRHTATTSLGKIRPRLPHAEGDPFPGGKRHRENNAGGPRYKKSRHTVHSSRFQIHSSPILLLEIRRDCHVQRQCKETPA